MYLLASGSADGFVQNLVQVLAFKASVTLALNLMKLIKVNEKFKQIGKFNAVFVMGNINGLQHEATNVPIVKGAIRVLVPII